MNAAEFGLRDSDLDYLLNLFSRFPEIEQVILFGSRATGTWRSGSDIDLAIIGEKLTDKTLSRLHFTLEEESPMLYFFNMVNYGALENEALKEQIDMHGKIIYKNSEKSQPS